MTKKEKFGIVCMFFGFLFCILDTMHGSFTAFGFFIIGAGSYWFIVE